MELYVTTKNTLIESFWLTLHYRRGNIRVGIELQLTTNPVHKRVSGVYNLGWCFARLDYFPIITLPPFI